MRLGYLALDQYGNSIHLTEPKYPRKQLLAATGFSRAVRIFGDFGKDGKTIKHVGYKVGPLWYTIYEVHSFEKKVKL